MGVNNRSFLMPTLSVFLIISCYGAPTMTDVWAKSFKEGAQVIFNVAPNMDLTYQVSCSRTCKVQVLENSDLKLILTTSGSSGGDLQLNIKTGTSAEIVLFIRVYFTEDPSVFRAGGAQRIIISNPKLSPQPKIAQWEIMGKQTWLTYYLKTIANTQLSFTFINYFSRESDPNTKVTYYNGATQSPFQSQDSYFVKDFDCNNPGKCYIKVNYVQDIITQFSYCTISFEEHYQRCGNGITEIVDSYIQKCDPSGTGCSTSCQIQSGYKCSGSPSACWKCGDNKVDSDETCDPPSGSCSSTCQLICGDKYRSQDEQCDNGGLDGCKNCKIQTGYNCIGQKYSTSNCQPICGDGIMVGYEKCDNGNQTGCLQCVVVPGYKCIGEVGQKSTCSISCGDGVKASFEACDNGNKPGCSQNCVQDKGYLCTSVVGQASQCSPICGDGIVVGDEECDNGMTIGCKDYNCKKADDGFTCTGGSLTGPSICRSTCGDGIKTATEQCDNKNQLGCSKGCKYDKGYTCTGGNGQISVCSPICGDMMIVGVEKCDNGKRVGCLTCLNPDPGYTCKVANKFVTYSTCTKA